jgi:hypothetical protein
VGHAVSGVPPNATPPSYVADYERLTTEFNIVKLPLT